MDMEPGFYWVKAASDNWEVMFFNRHGLFLAAGSSVPWHREEIDAVGPRVEPPEPSREGAGA